MTMTPRQQAEFEMGVLGTPDPAGVTGGAPRAWRKSLRYWIALVVGFVLGCITVGVLSVLFSIGL